MGLSRNKVAVPEGAAGTPPFWSPSGVFLVRGDTGGVLLAVEVISITRQVAGEKDEAARPAVRGFLPVL